MIIESTDVLAEIAATLRERRAKRDQYQAGKQFDDMQKRIDAMQRGYDLLVKCYHGECH